MRRGLLPARVCGTRARGPESITLDIDATLLTAHSEKELAAGNYKHGYGFHPLGCWLDETGRRWRRSSDRERRSNTAEDHFTVLGLALAQLPAEDLDREILVRTDIGGRTHPFTADCREANIRFSVGYELTETVRQAILELPETAWVQAINADGEDRDGAWVAELTDQLDLSAWPEGSRLICPPRAPAPRRAVHDLRRARLPAHVLSHRPGRRRHRRAWSCATAAAPASRTRIRAGKDTGMRNLPHYAFEHNQTWLEISLIAQDLLAWTKLICLDRRARQAPSPNAFANGCFTSPPSSSVTADAPTSSSIATGPGPQALAAAFTRLRAIPALC